jgi:hypothetical protein
MPGQILPFRGSLGSRFPTFPAFRPSVLFLTTTAHGSSRVASLPLASRHPAVSLWFVSPLRARWSWGTHESAPGPFGTPVALAPAAYGREAMGSPKFPRYPCACMPCSQTPVVSFLTRLSARKDCCLPPQRQRRLSFPFGWGSYPFDHDDVDFGVPYHGLHAHYPRLRTLHY